MKLGSKVDIAKRAIESISKHDDEDKDVREAALQALEQFIAAERMAMAARVAAKIAAQLG